MKSVYPDVFIPNSGHVYTIDPYCSEYWELRNRFESSVGIIMPWLEIKEKLKE